MASHDVHLMNAMAGRAARLDGRQAQARLAEVADVDPNTGTLRVILRPGTALSAWMPYGAIAVGGLQVQIPPKVGDQAYVDFLHGDSDHGVVLALLHSTKAAPRKSPFNGKPAQPDELLIMGPNGAALHLGQDGVWMFKGDLKVDGDVYDKHGSLQRLRANYNQHRDTDSRGDKSGLNDHQDPE